MFDLDDLDHNQSLSGQGAEIFRDKSVSHHGRGRLLHTAKDESLAVLPDLVLPIAQPVHQSWQNYRQKKRRTKGGRETERAGNL